MRVVEPGSDAIGPDLLQQRSPQCRPTSDRGRGPRGGGSDDGDADLPPQGPQALLDPPRPVRSLPGLVCPLSPSPLAHYEQQSRHLWQE